MKRTAICLSLLFLLSISQTSISDTLYVTIPPFTSRTIGFEVSSSEAASFRKDLRWQLINLLGSSKRTIKQILPDSVDYYRSLKAPIAVFSIDNYVQQPLHVISKSGYLNASLYIYNSQTNYDTAEMYCRAFVYGGEATGDYNIFARALQKAFAVMARKIETGKSESRPIPLTDALHYDPVKYCRYHDFFVSVQYNKDNIGYEPQGNLIIEFDKFFAALVGGITDKEVYVLPANRIKELNGCESKLHSIDFKVSQNQHNSGNMHLSIALSDAPDKIIYTKDSKIQSSQDWTDIMDFYQDMKRLFTLIKTDYKK